LWFGMATVQATGKKPNIIGHMVLVLFLLFFTGKRVWS